MSRAWAEDDKEMKEVQKILSFPPVIGEGATVKCGDRILVTSPVQEVHAVYGEVRFRTNNRWYFCKVS